jgi:hypothetical protein
MSRSWEDMLSNPIEGERYKGESMNTLQDLIEAIRPILPNALVVDTNDEVIIQTGLVSDLGGILMPAFEREGESDE